MALTLLIAIAVIGIVVLMVVALGVAIVALSGRENRQTVIIVVGASLLALFCCLAAGAGVIWLYFSGMPK
jgi:hypothetical protein